MADNVLEKIIIHIGLDTSGIQHGLQDVQYYIDNALYTIKTFTLGVNKAFKGVSKNMEDALNTVIQFSNGIQKGFLGFSDEVEDAQKKVTKFTDGVQKGFLGFSNGVETALDTVTQYTDVMRHSIQGAADGADNFANSANNAAAALSTVSKEGAFIRVAADAEEAAQKVMTLQERAKNFGQALGSKIRGTLSAIADPILSMLSAQNIVSAYFSDLSALNELTGKTSLSMEEMGQKQDLLARYTKKDLELYQEAKQSMESFGRAISDAAAPIIRALLPAVSWLGQEVSKVINFLSKHQQFVVLFITGMAAVISNLLVPAIKKWTQAMLANPMVLAVMAAIAVVAALALIVDDFLTYINGGESALADFWAIFGTGEEISLALSEAWEILKEIGLALWSALGDAAAIFFSYFSEAVNPLIAIFMNALKLIKAIFTGNFDEAIEHLRNLLLSIGEYILAIFTGAFNLVFGVVMSIFSAIGDFFTSIFDGILTTIVGTIKNIISRIPKFLLPDSIIEWAQSTDAVVTQTAAAVSAVAAQSSSGNAAGGISPASIAESVDNSIMTNFHGPITVTTMAVDAVGIAGSLQGALENKMVASKNGGIKGGH